MNKIILALIIVVLILFSIIIAGSLLLNLEIELEEVKSYTFPISVGDKTYTIGVRSNYSVSEVSYFGILKCVSVDFRGSLRATVFCEIIVPADLIWGELSIYKNDYVQSDDLYILSNNGTYHSVQMTFKHIAIVEAISIKGTEGVKSEVPYASSEPTSIPRMDNKMLFFENGTESKLYLINSSLNYENSKVYVTIPIKGRTLNLGEPVVLIDGEIINNYDKDFYFAISGDLFTSEGEKLEGTEYIMNGPIGEFALLHVPSFENRIFELVFKYDGQDIESYDLFLVLEPQDSPPA